MRPRFQRSVKFEPRMSEGLCTQMWSILESELLARRGVASSLSKCTTGKPAARSGDSGEPVLSSLPERRGSGLPESVLDRHTIILRFQERQTSMPAPLLRMISATLLTLQAFARAQISPKDGSACWIDCHCQLENIVQGTWRGGLKSKMALAL